MKITMRVLPVLLMFLVASCTSNKPSQEIQQAFNSKYKDAKDVDWKAKDGNWDATFEQQGVEYAAQFGADGTWLQTSHEIDFKQVPPDVWNTFTEKFGEKDLQKVDEVEMDGKTYYGFNLNTGEGNFRALYDDNGNFK